jgi:hypothetical protein
MVRKVITHSPQREVGAVNAEWLLSHPVHHESHLERRFIMICLACPCVRDVEHQPETIEISGEKKSKYTPDFRITLEDEKQEIVEVKPEIFIAKHQKKLDLAEKVFRFQDQKFQTITDQEIDKNGLGLRAILLMSFGRRWVPIDQEEALLKDMREIWGGSAKVKQLIAKGYASYVIWNLVARQKLQMPAGINLTDHETVSVNQAKENASDFFHSWFDIA